MTDFFTARIDGYDEHMSQWADAYRALPNYLPDECSKKLDLGCGTGLEIEEIYKKLENAEVTAVDLARTMLDALKLKYPSKNINTICGNYFTLNFENDFDAVISVESFHHFKPHQKLMLFKKIYNALKPGGIFVECDYIACCDEEEELLFAEAARKRKLYSIDETALVHFDTPLTAEHEISVLHDSGFRVAKATESISGATFILCRK